VPWWSTGAPRVANLREHRYALTPATLELVFPLVPGCGSYLAFSPHARGVRAGVGQALGWGGTGEERRGWCRRTK
jgi:hypothetical protein